MVVLIGCVALVPMSSSARTIYVDDDNSGGGNGTAGNPYPTIGQAVDNAGNNDTIYIHNGAYVETVRINRTVFNGSNLDIVGESRAGVVINGSDDPAFVLRRLNITVSDLTIEMSSYGFDVTDCSGRIDRVTVRQGPDTGPSRTGFLLTDCDGFHIDGLAVTDLAEMGQIAESKRCTISNSTSSYTDEDIAHGGITLQDSWGCIIENTTIDTNQTFGLAVSGRYDHTIRTSLVINGESIHYFNDLHGTSNDYEEITGYTLIETQVSTIGKITVANSSYVSIFDNELNNQPFGSCILLWNCENIDVGNNSINRGSTSVGDSGLTVIECNDIYVHNLTSRQVFNGIRLVDTTDTYLYNVTCIDNEWGIRIEGGSGNWINWSGASSNNQAGIALIDTEENLVTSTIMSGNDKYGYYIEGNFDNQLETSCLVNTEPVYYYNDKGASVSIDSLTLTANDVSNVGKVTLYNCRNIVVSDNILRNNAEGSGIFLIESTNITVRDNSMRNNLRGISLIDSRKCRLDDNDMDSDEYGLFIEERYDHWINMTNIANGEEIHYFFRNDSVDLSGIELTAKRVSNTGKITFVDSEWASVDSCVLENGTSGVLIIDSSANVTSSTLKNNKYGVTLESGSARVEGCDVLNNDIGIPAVGELTVVWNRINRNDIGVLCVDDASVENNTLNDNLNGIVIEGGDNHVAFNTVTNSTSSGIDVDGDNNVVRNNTCVENRYGIFVRGGNDIAVNWNRLRANDRYGIRLKGDPRNLDVSDNVAFGNGYNHLTGSGILITGANDLTLGRNVLYWNYYADVTIQQSDNVTVEGCILNGTYKGFNLYEASNITIIDNEISDSEFAIQMLESENILVTENMIEDAAPYGIWVRFSRNISVEDNEIRANESGVRVTGGRETNVRGNDIDAPSCVVIAASKENRIYQNVFGGDIGVEIRSQSYFTRVIDCNLSGPATGISIVDSNETVVQNCTFSGNDIAIYMYEAPDSRIEACDFYGIDVPLHLNLSDFNMIVDCNFFGAETGILIEESSRNKIKRATFERTDEALKCIEGFRNSMRASDTSGSNVPVNLTEDADAFFVNVTYDEGDIEINDVAVLDVSNWLRVRILFFDLTPIPLGDVYCLEDSEYRYKTNGYGGFDPQTNNSGETWWFLVAYKTYTGSSTTTPNVTVNASYMYWEDSRTVDMSTSHVEEFVSDIAPPNLKWTNETNYIDTGVYPDLGNASQSFEFRVLYTDPNGDAPLNGTPVVWIDVDNDGKYKSSFPYEDGTFDEGGFNMTKVGSSTDWASGVVFNFSTRLPVSHRIRYEFQAFDVNDLHAIRWDPVDRKRGPIVLSAEIDLRTVRFEDLLTEVHFTYQLSNDTYITDIDNSTASLWEDWYREIDIWTPSLRNISVLMDWSNSMPSRLRSSVTEWTLPFIENLTASEAVEVIKYSTDVYPISDFNSSAQVIADAFNTSVAQGSEAHCYDAIVENDLEGRRQHMLIIAFGPNYAENPKQHMQYEDLLGNISAGTTVHVIAHGNWDMGELLQTAIETNGQFIVVNDFTLPGALVEVLKGIQAEMALTYNAEINYDGSEHNCILNATHLMIDATLNLTYREPITPPPFVNISVPGGWWTHEALPANITVEGELDELYVQMSFAFIDRGEIGNWTEWLNVSVSGGFLDGPVSAGAYRFRVKGTSISGDSHGWINETSGNVTLVDVTPPMIDAPVPDSPSWNISQISFYVGNATDIDSDVVSLNITLTYDSGNPIDSYTVPWNGSGYQVLMKQMKWVPAVYNVTITVTNGAGLSGTQYAEVILDDSLPSIWLGTPTNWSMHDWANVQVISAGNVSNVTLQMAFAVVGSDLDPETATWTTLRVEDDGEVWSSFNFTHNASLMHARKYLFRAMGSNSQTGLAGPWEVSGVLMVDTMPPEVDQLILTGDRDGLFISFIASDDGSGVAGYSYIVYKDGSTFATGTGETNGTETIEVLGPAGEGTYRAVLVFTDVAGGVSDSASSGSLTITDGPPTVPVLVSPADGEIVGSPPTLVWNASIEPDGDDVSYDIVVNGPTGEIVRTSLTATTYTLGAIPLGNYTWSVSSSDGTYDSEAAEADFVYSRPDLEPSFIFFTDSPITYLEFPGTVTIAATVDNVGLIDSPGVNVTFSHNGNLIKSYRLTGVTAGGSDTISFAVDLEIGSHTMTMRVDTEDEVNELDEDNNTLTKTLLVGDEPEEDKRSDQSSLMPLIAGLILIIVLVLLVLIVLKLRKGGIKGKGSAPAKKKEPSAKMMDANEYEKLRQEFAESEASEDAVWETPKKKVIKKP